MTDRPVPRASPESSPGGPRSNELVSAILEASPFRFWRRRVRRASPPRGWPRRRASSPASLYQYFPNKAAILFRLQSDLMAADRRRCWASVLATPPAPAWSTARAGPRRSFARRCDEAAVRVALNDAAPLYRDAPEAQEAKARRRPCRAFMREALPDVSDGRARSAGDLITTTLSAVGKQFSETPRNLCGDRSLRRRDGRHVLRLRGGSQASLTHKRKAPDDAGAFPSNR